MSSQELKKKEKGKEIVTFEEKNTTSLHHVKHFDHTEEVSMSLSFSSEQGIAAVLEAKEETHKENSKKENDEKVGIQEKKSLSSKITPCIFYTSDDKARLRWSSDLHDCFVNAVAKLGGPDKATPKSVKEMMEVEGIALHHVKSHLQKFRLGKCNIRDESDPYNKRMFSSIPLILCYKTTRRVIKTYASSNSSRPQVNIRPKVMGAVKPKKAKEVHGSLYMLIERDLHLQRCREEERMQMAFAIGNNRNMLEAQHLKASTAPSITPSSYHFLKRETSPFKMNDSQQPTTAIPSTTTYAGDLCNGNKACLSLCDSTRQTSKPCSLYEPQHVHTSLTHSTQGKPRLNDSYNYNMAQGFINPYVTIEPQSMPSSSTVITQQELQLNDDCHIHNSNRNATSLPTAVLPKIDSSHQSTSNNVILLSLTQKSIQTHIPHHSYSTYPPYNTLEVVKVQFSTLQNSDTSLLRETTSRETNLSSSVTGDEEDPVDTYIDWDKVEEMDIELDPVEVLEALGFGVSPQS
ncbi:unnamed protein product [Thlaspi arvense]|uniref:HTH myb-type domain-containing protein n=1 Tax=Thlaspi arvense TaxID=13288 RepID=A0AAU9RVV7_THLAR|nr:unnamed protein product [Thlaspi arvense]